VRLKIMGQRKSRIKSLQRKSRIKSLQRKSRIKSLQRKSRDGQQEVSEHNVNIGSEEQPGCSFVYV